MKITDVQRRLAELILLTIVRGVLCCVVLQGPAALSAEVNRKDVAELLSVAKSNVAAIALSAIASNALVFVCSDAVERALTTSASKEGRAVIINSGRLESADYRELLLKEYGIKFTDGTISATTTSQVIMYSIFMATKFSEYYYLEEDKVVPWCYDYLRPYGDLMILDKEKNVYSFGSLRASEASWTSCVESITVSTANTIDKEFLANLRRTRATWLYANGHKVMAERAYEDALRLWPDSRETWLRYIDFLCREGRQVDAISFINKFILSVDPRMGRQLLDLLK